MRLKGLEIELCWKTKPLGTWSLGGVQAKTVARQHAWLVCRNCGVEGRGKYE